MSSLRGRKGRAFLEELLAALDALPEPRLIEGRFASSEDQVCALGAVARARGLDVSSLEFDPNTADAEECEAECAEGAAVLFGISRALAAEVMYVNDESWDSTPDKRFQLVRGWAERELRSAERFRARKRTEADAR